MRGPIFWLKAARAAFFTGSLAPIMVGTAMAFYETGKVNWWYAALALIALVCLHAGANLSNDYYDHLSGDDEINTNFVTPFTGGSRVIQQGLAQPHEVLKAAFVMMVSGAAIGLYLARVGGWQILMLGVIGMASGFFYTAPPFKLGYRGAGELFVFLDLGMLPVLAAYYLQTHTFSSSAVLAGVPIGLLIVAILWINQFQDVAADAAVRKRNWVVRLGRRAASGVHVGLMGGTYLAIIAGIAVHLFPGWTALAFLAFPLAIKAALVAVGNHDRLDQLTPANVATVKAHLVTSVMFSVGLVVGWMSHT